MTLRDRIARALAEAQGRKWKDCWPAVIELMYQQADAVLSALPCTLSQLEMIESGEMVLTPKVPVETRAFPAAK